MQTDLARTLATHAEPSRPLDLATLVERDACRSQVNAFHERWGESADITVALCESVAHVFDWNWAAQYLLPAPAWAEYQRACAPAWARLYITEVHS